jgi:hypothetical protein
MTMSNGTDAENVAKLAKAVADHTQAFQAVVAKVSSRQAALQVLSDAADHIGEMRRTPNLPAPLRAVVDRFAQSVLSFTFGDTLGATEIQTLVSDYTEAQGLLAALLKEQSDLKQSIISKL